MTVVVVAADRCCYQIKCTGQSPRSQLVKQFSPSSVSLTGNILIEKTFQIKNAPSPKIFALGDVVDLPGPRLGRAASMQGFFVADNIVRSIKGRSLNKYSESVIDKSIELTLGVVSAMISSLRRLPSLSLLS